jgi:amino acid transporter
MGETKITERLPLIEEEANLGNKFGTFAGVFTPSILTILGVIMFMRSGFVVGQSGILGAILILIIAKAITLLTALSVSAISTNMQVRGGGAYFMISRVLGPEFGGAIGLALFFAQALSVPFYIIGFTSAVTLTFPALLPYYLYISMGSGAFLLFIAYVGADWAIRSQFLIMIVLVLAVLFTLGGLVTGFEMQRFTENWDAGYTALNAQNPTGPRFNFWLVFAIYFPAVTGILAGVNMSGDLKDPAKSIPNGTFLALGVAFLVYLALALLAGGAVDRADLIDKPYESLKENALFGQGLIVAAGVFAASLSSALGSYLGAPRILQAVSRDDILSFLAPFAKGTAKGDEPRRALMLTALMTFVVLLWAGDGQRAAGESNPLDAVANILTMFFLYTYGMTNWAAFIEAIGRNPSFRPRFQYFHWVTALLGAVSCVGVALLIDPVSAVIAALILGCLLWYITTRELETSFGDARRGLVYTRVRKNLLKLNALEEDPKNWRPTILVFSGNPASREALVTFSVWLESGRGIVLMANVLIGDIKDNIEARKDAKKQLMDFCKEKSVQAFPVIAVDKCVDTSISFLLQTTSVGPIRPNLVMFGWTLSADRFGSLAHHLRNAETLGISQVLTRDRGVPKTKGKKRIDVWWRGQENGDLMVILAHLLTRNWEWVQSRIRVIRVVESEAEKTNAEEDLQSLIDKARVKAQAVAVVSDGKAFSWILYEESKDADCVFLGMELPDEGDEEAWHNTYKKLLKGLPTTLLINSVGGEDMFA